MSKISTSEIMGGYRARAQIVLTRPLLHYRQPFSLSFPNEKRPPAKTYYAETPRLLAGSGI